MTNVFGKSHPAAATFRSFTSTWGKMAVVDRLVEMVGEKTANVDSLARREVEWDVVDGVVVGVVEKVTHIEKGQEPFVRLGASTIHEDVDAGFDGVNTAFCRILILLIGFAMPPSG